MSQISKVSDCNMKFTSTVTLVIVDTPGASARNTCSVSLL